MKHVAWVLLFFIFGCSLKESHLTESWKSKDVKTAFDYGVQYNSADSVDPTLIILEGLRTSGGEAPFTPAGQSQSAEKQNKCPGSYAPSRTLYCQGSDYYTCCDPALENCEHGTCNPKPKDPQPPTPQCPQPGEPADHKKVCSKSLGGGNYSYQCCTDEEICDNGQCRRPPPEPKCPRSGDSKDQTNLCGTTIAGSMDYTCCREDQKCMFGPTIGNPSMWHCYDPPQWPPTPTPTPPPPPPSCAPKESLCYPKEGAPNCCKEGDLCVDGACKPKPPPPPSCPTASDPGDLLCKNEGVDGFTCCDSSKEQCHKPADGQAYCGPKEVLPPPPPPSPTPSPTPSPSPSPSPSVSPSPSPSPSPMTCAAGQMYCPWTKQWFPKGATCDCPGPCIACDVVE